MKVFEVLRLLILSILNCLLSKRLIDRLSHGDVATARIILLLATRSIEERALARMVDGFIQMLGLILHRPIHS
jgi:hypothetical protein